MPAPLGKVPTKKMPNIQVFGLEDNNATRGALRFFRERRIVVHFVDLRKKPIAAAELRRFTDRLGAAALLDTESRPYKEQGLAYLSTDTAGITSRLLADVRPECVIRAGNAALRGAEALLLSRRRREHLESIVRRIEHIELETDPDFFDMFVDGCQFHPIAA